MKAEPEVDADARQRYYDASEAWNTDVQGGLRSSRRIGWFLAGAAMLVAGLEAVALLAIGPLRTPVLYAFRVDHQTGYVQTIAGLRPGALTRDEALAQAFVAQYVIARETFDPTQLRQTYRKVMLWSAEDARATYQDLMKHSAPGDPMSLYTPTTLVTTTVETVSLLSPATALVRFQATERQIGAATGDTHSWTASVAFRYTAAPMTMGDRFLNPLGFQVTRYRREPEAPLGAQMNLAPPPSFPGSPP